MDVTDTPTPLTPEEADACLPLSKEAGWNQLAADWRMMLTQGQGFAIRDVDGVPRASALALPMGPRIGWISMVLVTETIRRRGIGKLLMATCIDWLESGGLVPFLDATPAGQPLYRTMGFAPVLDLRRMAGSGSGASDMTGLRPATADDLPWITALDREVFGGDRSEILADLLNRGDAPAIVCVARDGFALGRAGRTATQIGPVIAPDPAVAGHLVTAALARTTGPVLIDAVARHPLATLLTARGFTEQRPFLRMAKGRDDQIEDSARLFAAAGPELG